MFLFNNLLVRLYVLNDKGSKSRLGCKLRGRCRHNWFGHDTGPSECWSWQKREMVVVCCEAPL